MTWGQSYGLPFGDAPLEVVDDQAASVGGGAITFVFTDELDGPLPGLWELFALSHDGAGSTDYVAEPDPLLFRISDGYALWDYRRAPVLPGIGDAYTERGFAAAPANVLEGRNARVTVVLRQPVELLDPAVDEFVYSVTLALRADTQAGTWVGARMRARWASGVWVEPLVVEILQASGGQPSVLATATLPDIKDPLDIWRNQTRAELQVELRDDVLLATMDGVVAVSQQVPAQGGGSRVLLMVATFGRVGTLISALPSIAALSVAALRDFDALGPPPQIPGAPHLDTPGMPMIKLPIRGLLDDGLVVRMRGRQFKFVQDTTVTVQHQEFTFNQGEVVRIHEKLSSQEFVPATRDLHYERTVGSG